MSKLKITDGEFSITHIHEPLKRQISVNSYNPRTTEIKTVCDVYGCNDKEIRVNAELIADTFNTANETDKLPSEIKQERDQLIRVLQDFISSAEVIDDEHFSMEIDQAKKLINRIESK